MRGFLPIIAALALLSACQSAPVRETVTLPETTDQRIRGLSQALSTMQPGELDRLLPLLSALRENALENRFLAIMHQARELTASDRQDQREEWVRLKQDLDTLVAGQRILLSMPNPKRAAIEFLGRFQALRLDPVIDEPASTLQHDSGFTEPLVIRLTTPDTNAVIPAWTLVLNAPAGLRFDSGTAETRIHGTGKRGQVRITAASVDPHKNTASLSIECQAQPFLASLSRHFDQSRPGPVLTLSRPTWQLQAIPRAQTEFETLVARIRNTRRDDRAALDGLASSLTRLVEACPELTRVAANAQRIAGLAAYFPAGVCSIQITEPEETLYTSTGFASPLAISLALSPTNLLSLYRPHLSLVSPDGLRLAHPSNSISLGFTTNATVRTSLRVTSASDQAWRNRLSFVLEYPARRLVTAVRHAFPSAQFGLVPSLEEYRITARTAGGNSLYDTTRGTGASHIAATPVTNNLQAATAIDQRGLFTIGGRFGNTVYDLMYGHPNGVGPDGIWSSYASIRAGDRTWRISELWRKTVTREAGGALRCEAWLPDNSALIIQRLVPFSHNGQANIRIEMTLKNTSRRTNTFGMRLMLDTWAGMNDGVPFVIPGAEKSDVITHEVEFTPGWAALWQTYELPLGGSAGSAVLCMQNIMAGRGLVPPDRIAFANWPTAYNSDWDYYVDKSRPVTGDSAAILWWEPRLLKPGEEYRAATQFGVARQYDGPMLFSTDANNGEGVLLLRYANTTSQPVRIGHTVDCFDGQIILPQGESLSATVKPNEIFMKSVPVSVIGRGKARVRVTVDAGGSVRNWEFDMHGRPQHNTLQSLPVASAGHPVPVRYFFVGPVRRLSARLVDTSSRILSEAALTASPWLDGHLYSGTIMIPAATQGRIVLEVIE